MSSEAIEVTAEVIGETAIEPSFTPAVIDAKGYLDDRRAKIARHMEPYEGMTEDGLRALDKREVYNLRADVNKVLKAMESEVRTIKKEHMKPFDAFKEEADAVISQAKEAHALLDKVFKDKEALDRQDRRAQLENEYIACVGVLADVIPFDAVLDEKWLGDTAWKNGKAVDELQDKASMANDGYQTLQKKHLNHKTEVVKSYCETLDLMGALQLEDELNEEDRQRAEFEARQAELEALKAQRLAEAPTAEMQEQRAEAEAEAFEPGPAAGPSASPEVFTWSLVMEFAGTKQFAQGVASLLKSNGLTGATIKCKGVFNG